MIKTVIWVALLMSGCFAQLQLGDRLVPRDSCIVYIFIGHSNMTGRCTVRDTVTHPRLWNYGLDLTKPRCWVPAREQMYVDRTINKDAYGGPGMPFLKKMIAKCPDYHFCIIENGEGKATADIYLNNKQLLGRALYEEIMTPLKTVIKGKAVLGGIVCMLGLVEGQDLAAAAGFAGNVKNLVQFMRYELGDYDLPFFIGQYEDSAKGAFSPESLGAQTVIRQIDSLPSILANMAVIPSAGCAMNDDHHYSYEGYVTWTQRVIDAMDSAGWGPSCRGVRADKGIRLISQEAYRWNVAPNPVFSRAVIEMNAALTGKVDLSVYSPGGRFIRTLNHVPLQQGRCAFSWDGRDRAGGEAPAGAYIIEIRMNGESMGAGKITLLK